MNKFLNLLQFTYSTLLYAPQWSWLRLMFAEIIKKIEFRRSTGIRTLVNKTRQKQLRVTQTGKPRWIRHFYVNLYIKRNIQSTCFFLFASSCVVPVSFVILTSSQAFKEDPAQSRVFIRLLHYFRQKSRKKQNNLFYIMIENHVYLFIKTILNSSLVTTWREISLSRNLNPKNHHLKNTINKISRFVVWTKVIGRRIVWKRTIVHCLRVLFTRLVILRKIRNVFGTHLIKAYRISSGSSIPPVGFSKPKQMAQAPPQAFTIGNNEIAPGPA